MSRLLLPVSILLIFTAACTVYKEYPIEVLKSGEISLPAKIEKVAVIYRNFKYPGDTLQNYYRVDNRLVKTKNDPDNMDSILVYTCLNEMTNNLKKNNTFQQVEILPYNTFKRHVAEKLPAMPAALLQRIDNTGEADWLISLETYSCFYSKYPENFESPESSEVITVSVWGIYDLLRQKIIDRKTIIDTVFWNGYDNQGNYIKGYKLPARLKALEIASAKAGEIYAKRFYASWQTVNRVYSIPPLPDFTDAAYYFEEGKMDNAIDLWKKYTGRRNGKLAINAYYNLALAYEMKDEIETALKYLEQAHELALAYRSKEDLEMIQDYKEILMERIKEINRINK
jgi:tetratricopeptide (TPR) repeat protein